MRKIIRIACLAGTTIAVAASLSTAADAAVGATVVNCRPAHTTMVAGTDLLAVSAPPSPTHVYRLDGVTKSTGTLGTATFPKVAAGTHTLFIDGVVCSTITAV
jgi:hypothetical protein